MANASLLTIVNDILDFSKVELVDGTGKASFSLLALIEDAMVIVFPIAAAKNLVLESVVDPNVPAWLTGDEARLRQVLLTCSTMPLSSLRRARSRSTCAPDLRRRGERIRFSVTDTGIGIAPEQQHRLFKKFSQADSSVDRDTAGQASAW